MRWTENLKEKWITSAVDNDAVSWAESFAKYLAESEEDSGRLTTSQLRKFFGKLRQIEADFDNLKIEIPMLKPKLAYSVGRDWDSKRSKYKTKISFFYSQISLALSYIEPGNERHFKNLVLLVESIVAFHKYHGGE